MRTAHRVTCDDFNSYRIAEFWSKFKLTPTGCMEFTGSVKDGRGYTEKRGRTARAHRRVLAPRAAYAMTWGECPADMHVLHSCDNPLCINPVHLSLGTHADNMRDMVRKGRHWTQQRKGQPRTARAEVPK